MLKALYLAPITVFLIYVNDFQNFLQFFHHKCLSELTLTANTQLENVNKWLIAKHYQN